MLWEATDRLPPAQELNESELEAIRQMLRTPVMLKAFRMLRTEVEARHASVLKCNLGTPEGVAQALKLQGESAGLARAFQFFEDLLPEGKSDDRS